MVQSVFKKTSAPDLAGTYSGGLEEGTVRPALIFVYNRGNKIDFNHLNRKGHAVLANGLTASKSCGF
jgi:hypothetical protein